MAKQPSIIRKLIFVITSSLLIVLLLVIAGEITCRLIGRTVYNPAVQQNYRIEPPYKHFFVKHKTLGYFTGRGVYTIIHSQGLRYRCTNNKNGLRINEKPKHNNYNTGRPEVWVLGGSFTYGWGVDDADTYLWKTQKALPGYKFVNLGTPGHGTLQNLIHIKEKLKTGNKPEKVILAYAGFHNERNILSRAWGKKMVRQPNKGAETYYPFASIDGEELVIKYKAINYSPTYLAENSALINLMEEVYGIWEHHHKKSEQVAQQLIQQISQLCTQKGIEFYLMTIFNDESSDRMAGFCEKEDIRHIDNSLKEEIIKFNKSLDLFEEEYFMISHPNAKGHSLYAKKLITYFNNSIKE